MLWQFQTDIRRVYSMIVFADFIFFRGIFDTTRTPDYSRSTVWKHFCNLIWIRLVMNSFSVWVMIRHSARLQWTALWHCGKMLYIISPLKIDFGQGAWIAFVHNKPQRPVCPPLTLIAKSLYHRTGAFLYDCLDLSMVDGFCSTHIFYPLWHFSKLE